MVSLLLATAGVLVVLVLQYARAINLPILRSLPTRRPNGVILMLARESLFYKEHLPNLQNIEESFNRRFGYPILLLSEEPLKTDAQRRQLAAVTGGKATWGGLASLSPLVACLESWHAGSLDDAFWSVPANIDREKLRDAMAPPADNSTEEAWKKVATEFPVGVSHLLASRPRRRPDRPGFVVSQHVQILGRYASPLFHMFAGTETSIGLFYKHPLVRPYDYIWRIDSDIKFYCQLNYDPIAEMAKRGQKYGRRYSTALAAFDVLSLCGRLRPSDVRLLGSRPWSVDACRRLSLAPSS